MAKPSILLRELTPKEFPSITPLLQQLGPDIPELVLKERLTQMTSGNYHCLGAFDQEKLIGCSGFWILHKYYVGKHIEPDNVIIHPNYQNQGLGHQMMDWLEDYAKAEGCQALELNCYIDNPGGLRFWRSRGYRTIGEHMKKDLGL